MTYPSIQQCPGCSRVMQFAHTSTNIKTCGCGTVVERKESGELHSKAIYILQHSDDLIQPGSQGLWKGQKFTVLGRIRAWMEELVFNYWTVAFEDGSFRFLGEAYGLYAIYEKTAIDQNFPESALTDIKIGVTKELIPGKPYLLERKYTCYKWEIEGEVFWPEPISGFKIFEWAYVTGDHIELIQFEKTIIKSYAVEYVSFADLHLSNLRDEKVVPKTVSCAHCSAENVIKVFPYTQSYACVECGVHYFLQDGVHFKQKPTRNQIDKKPDISLGSTGVIKGIKYEVIGFALKEEKNQYRSKWKEYTLYNRQEGFAFLSEYNGHWIYLREKGDAPVIDMGSVSEFDFGNEPFQLFNSYRFEVLNAAGAFPYNAFNDGDKDVKEFISPPEMWSREKSAREGIIWFFGEHVNRAELKKAFGKNIRLPLKTGVGAVEPKGFISTSKLIITSMVALTLLVLTHVFTNMNKQEREIFSGMIPFADTANTSSRVTPVFLLEKWRSNLQFDVHAPVNNSWLEFNATLVNSKTGTEYTLEKGVEYYSGYSDGEHWTEGSTQATAYMSEIPAGEYQLQISGIREQLGSFYGGGRPDHFLITVTYDTPNHRNLVVCMVIFCICAFAQYLYVQFMEKSRWYNSPFSPFNYED